jgi:chloramphenicol-sensitive protein RarD
LFLGRVILKEAVNRWQVIAGLVALLAIVFELIALGGIPWVSLVLAFSFGLYGLVRKQQPLNSLVGLTLETLWMLPIAVVYLAVVYQNQMPSYGVSTFGLLVISGVVTAVPLLMFAASVRSLNLVVAGFLMYLNPLMQFVSAVWILNETVPAQRYVTFVLVWVAMGLFITGLYLKHKSSQQPASP